MFREHRIAVIRDRMRTHQPSLILMYGIGEKKHWEAISGQGFPPGNILSVGRTILTCTRHPVGFGLPDRYWTQLAEKVRSLSQNR
jgi:hypothetical protein